MDPHSGINAHHILKLLVDKTSMSDNDATLFLKELISVVTESIIHDKVVDIDSLGHFNSKSYHEEDGHEHYYLDFVPSVELSGAVNKPFANFETTLLNEGIELDGVLIVDSSVEKIRIDEESVLYSKINTPFEIVHELQPEPNVVVETEEIYDNDLSYKEFDEELSEIEAEEPIVPIISDELDIENDFQPSLKDDDLESDKIEDDKDNLTDDTHTVGGLKVVKEKRKSKSVLIALVASVVVILAASAFFLQKKANIESAKIGIIGGVDNAATHIYISEELDTVENVVSASIDSIDVVSDTIQEVLKPEVEPIVRPEVITLTMGKTLRLIALEKYGHREYWVYIYLENKSKIANPNNVPVGVKLIIPPKEKYGINSADPNSVRKAVSKGNEVMSKFR